VLLASLANDLRDKILEIIDTIGYAGVAFLVALENVFPPIPSEVVLPAAGFSANNGDATLIGMIIAATIGSVVGAWILYLVAAWIGPDRLDRFLIRYGRWIGVKPADVARANSWFDDHANKAVLICRCVPLIRSLVSIPAGFRRMDALAFTAYTALGSLVWNTILIGAGYQLGDNWEVVEEWVSKFQYVVIAAIAAVAIWWLWARIIAPTRKARREGRPPAGS
jgi:membrane protein DedA with SNARE-associated domain